MRTRIFIGSSREAIEVCRAVQQELFDDFDVTVWNQDVFRLSQSGLQSLLDQLDSSDAGIFVLKPDDLVMRRGATESAVRDNVILELGMFIGRLGSSRTLMLTPTDSSTHLPSDLLGITTAGYDFKRTSKAAAVGPACTKIRRHLLGLQTRITEESPSRKRLDRAMGRLSSDLEWLLEGQPLRPEQVDVEGESPIVTKISQASVRVEFGRIQDFASENTASVIALPANEYFDDECIFDLNSSLGAFVQHHFAERLPELLQCVRDELVELPTQRVPRAEHRVDESYGIGQAIFLRGLSPDFRVILVSATTERTGVGLRAEPHFLYASIQGIIEKMNEHRLRSLTIPVLGAGHGGMPINVSVLFNLLALRSILREDLGRHLREVRIVVFRRPGSARSYSGLSEIVSRIVPAD